MPLIPTQTSRLLKRKLVLSTLKAICIDRIGIRTLLIDWRSSGADSRKFERRLLSSIFKVFFSCGAGNPHFPHRGVARSKISRQHCPHNNSTSLSAAATTLRRHPKQIGGKTMSLIQRKNCCISHFLHMPKRLVCPRIPKKSLRQSLFVKLFGTRLSVLSIPSDETSNHKRP